MSPLSTSFIVPILTSKYFESESLRKERHNAERSFVEVIRPELDKLLGFDWKLYVHIRWTDDFFGLSESNDGYGKMLSRSKRGGTFSISKTGLANLLSHIETEKLGVKKKITQQEVVDYVTSIAGDVLARFNTDDIETHISRAYGDGRIQVYLLRTREGFNSTHFYFKEMTSYIMRDGTHTEPELLSSASGKTITEFNQLIEAYTPHMNRLNKVVEEIKAALPKEYFV